jgi:hypothetical protein
MRYDRDGWRIVYILLNGFGGKEKERNDRMSWMRG